MPAKDVHRLLARVCAECIRAWHRQCCDDASGRRHEYEDRYLTDMDEVRFERYRERVAYFTDVDLTDLQVQREIALEQQSRLFEWAYSRVVPATLWYDASRKLQCSVDRRPPENLGQAASWILEVTSLSQQDPATVASDKDTASGGERRADLLDRARGFYRELAQLQEYPVGGINAAISCSIERYERSRAGGTVRLVTLQELKMRIVEPMERENDFLDALRSGDVKIESTIGEPGEGQE